MADRSVSVPMTLSDLKRRNTSVKGKGLVLRSAMPAPQAGWVRALRFFGFRSIYTYTFVVELSNLTW